MGKTSALGVVEQSLIKARFLPENIVWVPRIEATSATLLLEILCTQLQVPGNIGQLRSRRSFLYSLPQHSPVWSCSTTSRHLNMRLMEFWSRLRITFVGLPCWATSPFSSPCGEDIFHAPKLSNGSRRRFSLQMKLPAFLYTAASIQNRKTILMSVGCFAFWDTCLLLWHSWQDWARKGTQRRVDSSIVRERAWNPPWPLWTEHEPKRQPFYWQQPDEAEPSSPPPEYSLLPTCRNSENKSSLVDTSTLLSNGGWNFSMVPSAIATLSPRRDYWSRIEGKILTLQSSLCFLLSSRLFNSMAG